MSNPVMSTSDIKRLAMRDVKEETRGFPALTLISCARLTLASARTLHANGYLRDALRQYVKTGGLIKNAMISREYRVERSEPLRVAFDEFMAESEDLATSIIYLSEFLDSAKDEADKGRSWSFSQRGTPGGCDLRQAVVASTLSAVRDNTPPSTPHLQDMPFFMFPTVKVQWAKSEHSMDAKSQLRRVMERAPTLFPSSR